LQESKVGMVNNATAAIIRQMIISLFEWVGEEMGSSQMEITSSAFAFSHAQDALLILSDVTCLLDERKCEALDLSKVDKPFALDLIESVLVNHGDVIRAHKPFSTLIQDRICPYLIENLKQLNESKPDFAKTCRHWRIIQLLITEFNDLFPDEIEIFIAFGIRILRESNLNWECAMVLEVTKIIFQSQNLIEEIYLICQKKESPRIFKDLMEVTMETIKKVLDSQPSDSQGQIADALGKSSVLTQFDKSAPPPVSPIALLLLAYESLNGWFNNLSNFIKFTCSEKNQLGFIVYKSSGNVNINPNTVSIITDLILFCGLPLCQLMQRIFVELCFNQIQLHNTTIEFFSRAFVIFSVFEFRSQLRYLNEILLSLAKGKCGNLLIIQMILETGHGIGELLEDSLFTMVQVIQITEQLQNQKSRKQQVQGINQHPQMTVAEDDILAKAIDLSVSFTESTVIWDEKSFYFLIQAYKKLIEEESQVNSDEKKVSSLLLILNKLKRLTSLNMMRFVEGEKCSLSWELLMEEFGGIMKSKDISLRQSSIETVGLIVDLFIKSVPPSKMKSSSSPAQGLGSSCDNLQMRILSPLKKFAISVLWVDVHRVILDSVIKYLHVFGECLSETSWSLIWSILQEDLKIVRNENNLTITTTDSQDSLIGLYQKVHDTVKIASGDFLASIPMACFAALIDIIAQLGEISFPGELNIPLNTVRYLWDISDFLCSKSVKDVFGLWKGLLRHLTRLSLDSRPELRNSAVQTLLRTINMNGSSLKGYADKWNCLFEEIIFEFLKDLRATATESKAGKSKENSEVIPLGFSHFSRDSETKQWDETESTVMTGVSTLLLTHFKGILYDLHEFPPYWCHFLKVLKDYALLKDGSVELTGVSISCLLQLSLGLKEVKGEIEIREYSTPLWEIWVAIGSENGKFENFNFFTQDSLLKYFKIFANLLELCEINDLWLESSLKVLTGALQCPTPSDQVKDIETATEVQKFLLNLILTDLIKKGNGKILILNEISKWLRLSTNSNSNSKLNGGAEMMISMGYASLRSRQSTTSSTAKSKEIHFDLNEKNVNIKYSFIAMTSILLERIPGIICSWKGEVEIYSCACLISLIESIGQFMKLKYKSPMNNKMEPIWKTSTSVFISVMKTILEEQKSNLKSGLWPSILNVMKFALHSSKEMFNRSLKIEENEEDERFDCQLIDLIVDFMIPRALKDDDTGVIIDELIDLIFQVSRITKFSDETGDESLLFPSGVKTIPVAVKEILAFSAYKALFRLVSRDGGNSSSSTSEKVLEKLKKILKKHLEAFETDRKIFGNEFPFPRLRDLELEMLLKGLINLKAVKELKEVYEFIVRCADFGGGGCEGARMIVKDCRRVLLLLSGNEEEIEEKEEKEDGIVVVEEEEEEEKGGEEENYKDIQQSRTRSRSQSQSQSQYQSQSQSLLNLEILKLAPPPSRTTTLKTISSRRSVGEEFLDHLTHDLRLMEISSQETIE
jgi:hypothetical protein